MPYCPTCRNEYVAGVSRCADCEVDLVDSLEALDAAMAAARAEEEARRPDASTPVKEADLELDHEELPIYATEQRVADVVASLLNQSQIPCYVYPHAVVVEGRELVRIAVPPEFGGMVRRVLQHGPRFSVETVGATAVLGPPQARPAREEDVDETLRAIQERLKDVASLGPEDLPEMEAFLYDGHIPDEIRARVAAALCRTGIEAGRRMVEQAVIQACKREDETRCASILAGMQSGDHPDIETEIVALLAAPSAVTRKLAANAAGNLHCESGLGALVDALSDASPDVRVEAREALFALTGETFGYDPHVAPERNAEALSRWRRFLESRRD